MLDPFNSKEEKVMLKGMRFTPWQQQLLIAVTFCGAYLLLHKVFISYWMPHYGLWFGGVLLLPRRFWSALVFSNIVAVAPVAYACFDQYGWGGSLLHLVPVSTFAMLLIWPLRAHLPGTVSGKWIVESVTARHIVVLLICIFAFALISTADMTLQLIQTRQPQDDPSEAVTWSARLFLGAYLGCLIMVPLALAIHEAIRQADSWTGLVRKMGRSRLLLEGVLLGLSCVGLLTALGAGVAGEMGRQTARTALFLPVAWMAVRYYGWQGAAVGGTAASVGIMLAMPAQYDPGTIDAQTVMAFCLTLLLPLSARLNGFNEQERQQARDHLQVRHAARGEIYQGELRLRHAMEMQAQAHEYLHEGYGRLLERVRDALPEEEHRYFRTLLVLVRRFWSSVKKSFLSSAWQWQPKGLAAALWSGPIAETLEECGVVLDGHISDRVSLLSPGAQWTLYRLACEAVAYTLMQYPATPCLRLYLRVMKAGPARTTPWAVLAVVAEPEPLMATPILIALPRNRHLLLSRLGATGLDLAGMRDRASLYDGKLRPNARRQRLTLSLLDAPDTTFDAAGAEPKPRRAVKAM